MRTRESMRDIGRGRETRARKQEIGTRGGEGETNRDEQEGKRRKREETGNEGMETRLTGREKDLRRQSKRHQARSCSYKNITLLATQTARLLLIFTLIPCDSVDCEYMIVSMLF